MVPEGWEEHLLQELCEEKIVYGIVQAGDHFEDGIPYIKSSDVGGEINVSGLAKTDPAIHSRYKRSTVGPGDIIFSLRGNTGETSIVPDHLNEANLTQGTARIAVNNKADNRFLKYQLGSHTVRARVHAVSKGSTFTEISLADLRRIPVSLPALPEQKKIAEILSTWDKAIETTEKLLANAEAQKKALMQQLLTGKRRLNGFEEKWREVTLAEITDFIRDGTHGTHERVEIGVPMISAVNVTAQHEIDIESAPRIPRCDYEKLHKKYEISEGDVLVTIVGTLGRSALVKEKKEFTAQRSVAIIRASSEYLSEFLSYVAQTEQFQAQLKRRANVTAQPGVYLGELAKIPVPYPKLEEQKEIATVIRNALIQANSISKQLAELRSEKRALMQQLLTGKRRVRAS